MIRILTSGSGGPSSNPGKNFSPKINLHLFVRIQSITHIAANIVTNKCAMIHGVPMEYARLGAAIMYPIKLIAM